MTTSQEIQAEEQVVKTKIENLEQLIHDTQKPFYQMMKEATAELVKNRDALKEQEHELSKQYAETFDAEKKAVWKDKVPTTPEEFKQWLQNSGKQPFGSEERSFWSEDPIQRTYRIGEVTVFGVSRYGSRKFYVGFKGTKVYAYMNVKTSEHVGDSTRVYASMVNGEQVNFQKTYGGWTTSDARPLQTFLKAIETSLA